MFIRGARTGILFLVVAILVSGCVPSTPATSTDAPASAASSPGARLFGSFGKQAIASVMDVLTRAGIEVDTNDGTAVNVVAGPASPVHVNQTQLRNMTLEVTSNAGTRGRTLDGLVPSPTAGAPGPAQWIAAYADKADTVGGRLARQLLAPQDLHRAGDLIIPGLVQVLFVSDVATQLAPAIAAQNPTALGEPPSSTTALASTPGVEPAGAVTGTDEGPCETFGGPISDVIFNVLQTLKELRITAPTIKTGIPFLDSLVQGIVDLSVGALNFAIQAGVQIVVGAAKFALAPILDAIALGAGVVAIVVNVLNAVKSWTVRVVPAEASTAMGVEGQSPITDEVKAVVDVGGLTEWPTELAACAHLANVTLPSLKPGAAQVFWSPLVLAPGGIDLARVTGHEDALRDTATGGEATLTLQTGQEPKEQAENASGAHPGIVRVDVRIRRKEIEDLRTSVLDLLIKMLPKTGIVPLDDAVSGFIREPLDSMLSEIVKVGLDETASEFVTVVYHDPPRPKPTPSESQGSHLWQGQWLGSDSATGGFTLDITLTQTSLSGTISIANSACATSGSITGVVSGSNVTFGSVQAGEAIAFTGTISADRKTMQGTYESPPCGTRDAGAGTWIATRQ